MRKTLIPLVVGAGLLLNHLPVSAQQQKAADQPAANQPKTAAPRKKANNGFDDSILQTMDHGPFYAGSIHGKTIAFKGIAIKLAGGQAGVSFDTELMRMADGWTGGYLTIKGERTTGGHPSIDGKSVFNTEIHPGWSRTDDFTDPRSTAPEDPKGKPVGPLPRELAKYKGLYRDGDKIVLSYSVGKTDVLELPGFEDKGGLGYFTRTFNLGPSTEPLNLLVMDNAGQSGLLENGGTIATLDRSENNSVAVGVPDAPKDAMLQIISGQVRLKLPVLKSGARFTVAIWSGEKAQSTKFAGAIKSTKSIDLTTLTHGGPARWGQPLKVPGKLGAETGAYVVDTITVPEDNPFKSWIRCSGVDFFSDGTTAAICSLSGDVWLVRNIDGQLDKVTWQRFATGLYQPLGLKIVKDQVYVTCRDQITRLTDLNKDGEADFYENFNNDVTITDHYHEFCFDLQTDSKGNFYFAKGGNLGEARLPHHGTLMKLPPDGSKLEIVCAGFREPNGMSIGPKDEITVGDNEGNWVPSSRVNLIKPGGLYGHVWNYHGATHPNKYDAPLFWIPHSYDYDNSSGGQVWVTSDKWGPLKGELLHTSYGACLLFRVMQENVEGVDQAAVFKFPLNFDSGIMRGRFNEKDGQLYVCGLNVWQSNNRSGQNKRGIFQRVRYTGKPVEMPKEFHVRPTGLAITFTTPLDPATATDPQNYSVEQWNYLWTKNYGSPDYKVSNPEEKGRDTLEVKSAKLSADKKTVTLELGSLKPVMQMKIKFNIKAASGTELKQEIHNTINKVPTMTKAAL